MRDDPSKESSFQVNSAWDRQKYLNDSIVHSPKDSQGNYVGGRAFKINSLSGNERNRTFLRVGDNFADVSLVSGTDDLSDGRSFSLLDFDGDGWQDIALMSLNEPRFKLFRNRMSEIYPDRRALRIRLEGGNESAESSGEWSNRNGIGARLKVNFQSGETMLLHRQAGEGFAGQNSATLQVGVLPEDAVQSIEVAWPSGKTSRVETPDLSSVCVIRERSNTSND